MVLDVEEAGKKGGGLLRSRLHVENSCVHACRRPGGRQICILLNKMLMFFFFFFFDSNAPEA